MADEQQLQEENPYRALIRNDQDRQQGQLRDSLNGAKPDARAEALRLAAKYRMPHELVERNLEAFKQREVEDLPEERRLLRLNPKLADWLTSSPAAAAAADDLPKLQELDNRLTFGASILRGVDQVQGMVGGFLEATGELTRSERLTRYGREVRTHNEAQAAALGYRSSVTALRGPWDLVQYVKELIGEQIPVMAPILAGGAAGAAAGSVVPGVGTTIGAIIGAAVPSFVLGVGESEGTLKEVDPTAQAPGLVFLGGSAIAALDSVLPAKVGGRLVATFGRETAEEVAKRALLSPVAPRFLRGVSGQGVTDMATEALTEALQEAIGQVTGHVGAGEEVDWRQVGNAMLEAGAAGGIVGGTVGAGTRALSQRRLQARFAAAQQSQVFFQALGQSSVDSKLLERLPAGARELVARLTKDGPVETVYAPTSTFEEYWQSQGVDPAVMAAELTGKADALQHARETGADLAIPLADYATKLAATDHNEFFQRELRLAPNLMNAREAEQLQAEFEKVQAEGVQQNAVQQPVDAGAQEVGRRIHEQALAAGESDQVAGAWAKLYETVYGQLGQRYKRDALQLFEQRPLAIQRDDGVIFTPAAPGERIGVDIPRSEATPGESREQRSTRRMAHLEALTAAYTRDARRLQPDVDPALIRHELERRIELADMLAESNEESGRGQDLLRAIAAYGGIVEDATEGEFRELAAEGFDKRRRGIVLTKHGERTQTFGRKEWNGVPGVFMPRASGRALTPDGMVEALGQDARFAYIEDMWDLLNAIEVARRSKPDVDIFPGTEELQELGIVPGQKWWEDSWQDAPAEEAAPSADAGEAVEELVEPRPLEESVGQLQLLERLASEEALGVVVPGESKDPLTGEVVGRMGEESYFRINGQERRDLRAVNCTDCAEAFLETSGAGGVIVGYPEEANGGRIAQGMGHDFVIVDGQFLVDPWAHQVEGSNPRAVFNLADPQDLAFVKQQYADPKHWVQRQADPFQPHTYSWYPYSNELLGAIDPELLQTVEDRRRSHRTALDNAITRVRQQDTALGSVYFEEGMHAESRMVPFQVAKDNRTIMRAFGAATAAGQVEATASDRTVPLEQVFATQHTFRPDVVEEYLRYQDAGGQNPRPFAVQVEDRFYIGDGHHRALAQWATGRKDLDLRVVESGLTIDELGEGAEAFTITDEATLAGARTAGTTRGTAADLPTTPEGRALEEERQRQFDEWLKANPRVPGHEYFQIEQEFPDGFEVVAEHLTPREAARLRHDTAQRLLDVFETLPRDEDYEDAAVAGMAKRGWYERSTKALRAVFGPVDSVRFAAVLAATSPKTSVEQNLLNALRLWVNWDQADRPTAPAHIKRLLARSVQAGGVLPAWSDNVVRALRAEDPLAIQLSGPKVDSFMHNLWGHMNAVTNDAWMAAFALVNERVLAGRMQAQRDESGTLTGGVKMRGANPGYLALSVKIRRVARTLTRKTGITWTPANVQETVWAWAKTIYELAEAEGTSAVRVLKEGGLTDAAIAQTPDFEQLFVMDAEVREILEAGGYGEVLATLEKQAGRAARRRHAATGGIDQATARGVTPALLRGAKRLDTIRKQRHAALEAQRNEGLKRATRKLAEARRAFRGRGGAEYFQVEEDRFDPRKFATRTELVASGRRELGTSRILTPEDLATAAVTINANAVERFDAVVTNKRGIPQAIVGSFKGRVDSVAVHPEVLLAEAIRVPDAAAIWFVHNHPSGQATLSPDDRRMIGHVSEFFADTGIEPRGIMAIGESGAYHWYNPVDGNESSGHARGRASQRALDAGDKPRKVPIVERQFASTGKLAEQLSTPQAVVARIGELSGGEFGVLLLDTKHHPLAFLAIDEHKAHALRRTGELRELLKGVSVANAKGAIVYSPGAGDGQQLQAAKNLALALKRHQVDVLDLVATNPHGLPVSVLALQGPLNLEGEFFQEDLPAAPFHSRIVAAVQASTQASAPGRQWKGTIRNAGVNEDEYHALAVQALDDGTVYSKEALLEHLNRHRVDVRVLELVDNAGPSEKEVTDRANELFAAMVDAEVEQRIEAGHDPYHGGDYEARESEEEIGAWEAVLTYPGERAELLDYYDTEEEAEAAAQRELDRREEQLYAEFRTDVANSLDWNDAMNQARDQLEDLYAARRTHYSTYVRPGGVQGTYREVFLTAPGATASRGFHVLTEAENRLLEQRFPHAVGYLGHADTSRHDRIEYAQTQAADALRKANPDHPDASQYTDRERQVLAEFARILQKLLKHGATFGYDAGGWDDGHDLYAFVKNPIVRVRFNAHVAVDGTRTMFLEEVQPPDKSSQALIPPLFKKHWRELAFKWALHHAAVNGYQRLAWTSGAMQVQRYDLRSHVDRIEYYPESRQLAAFKGRAEQIRDYDVSPDDLGKYIGEDVAVKLLASPEQYAPDASSPARTRFVLQGADLEVGGEGLARLYDVEFPQVVNKLPAVKKAGVKVAPAPVPFGTTRMPFPANRIRPIPENASDARRQRMIAERADALQKWDEQHPPIDDVETVPAIDITPALRERLLAGQALFQDPPEGAPKAKGGFNPSTNVIRLVSGKADLSTFLHESGHFFLELLGDIATTVKADTEDPQELQLLADVATVLKHGGFQGTLAEWRQLPVDSKRQVHEAFARSFEQYLSDGRAPSSELRDLFVRFRDWLVAVYRSARGLGIEVNPELRGVFDRLLASDEAIADAQHEAQVVPLLTDPATAGVDPLTFAAYQREIAEASRASREELDRLLLRDWRREREAWWKAERELVRAAVAEEVHRQPAYIAIAAIRHGRRPDGSQAYERPVKLARRAILSDYGREWLERLKGKQLYSAEGGTHPDTAAELFGFSTGEQLLEAIAAAPPMAQVIDAEADRRMREKHGDLLLDGMELREQAEAAVFEHRARVISAELEALTKGMAGAAIPPAHVIKAQAEALIRRLPVRELRPGNYLNAARRASQTAFWHFGRNDRRLAIQAKQQELLALAHWRAARDAKERADSIRDRLKRYADKQSTRARIGRAGAEYLEQIDGFLERYEFARVPKRDVERRQSLRKFVAQLEADGLPIQIPEEVLEDARTINWQELPLEQLEGVAAAVEQIAHLARLKNKLLKARDQRELQQVRAEVAASIRDNVKQRVLSHEPRSHEEKRRAFFEGIFASHRKIASLARELDGFQDAGPMWERVIRPLNEAGNREASMNADATARLLRIFEQHYGRERLSLFRKQHVDAIGAALSKQARLMVALNWGNETNRQRVINGKNWTPQQVDQILATLDRRDWQFVQDVWDFIDTYWEDIAAKQRRVTGLAPPKVEPIPVFTRFGEFRGGYFPLMYEGDLSTKAQVFEETSALELQKAAAYVHAVPASGHTKERTEGNVRMPVRLDFGVIFEHTTRVIHDLTHHETLIDVGRIVGSEEVQGAIKDTLGPRAFDQFKRALRDIAVGDVPPQHEVEAALAHLRTGSTVVGLGWSVSTMLLQPLGLTQSMQRIGIRPVVRGLAKWFGGAVRMEAVVAGIHEKSEFMRNRHRTQMREVNEIRNRIGVDTGKFSAAADTFLRGVTAGKLQKQDMLDSYFWGIAKLQQVADVPTWLGAYEKARDNDVDEDTAVQLADQAVLDSQGGGQIKDLAAVQRGGAAWKLWTNFYSFFNTTYNLWVESTRQARRERAVGRLAVDYLLLFAVPAVLGRFLQLAIRGELEDELEDPEAFAIALAGELGSYMAGTMIGLRELGGALEGYAGYEGPAGARGVASVSRTVTQIRQLEADEAFWRALNTTAGAFFHYPAAQVERTVRGVKALLDGDTQNPLAPLAGPPRED